MGKGEKVTDNPIDWKHSIPDSGGYGVYDTVKNNQPKKSKEESLNTRLKLRIDDLLDESTENFLYFDKDLFIPLEGDFEKIIGILNDNDDLIINSPQNNSIKCELNNNKLSELFLKITSKNENEIFENNISNIYLIYGLIEYHNDYYPIYFIPVNFSKDIDEYKISRNFDLNCEINPYIHEIRSDIPSSVLNLDYSDLFIKLKSVSGLKIIESIFLGNINFKSINCINDIKNDEWINYFDKLGLFFEGKNSYYFNKAEIIKLNNNIASNWNKLNLTFKNNISADILIKNLLNDGKSILYISNFLSRKIIRSSLSDYNLNELILDFDNVSSSNILELLSNNENHEYYEFEDYSNINNQLISIENTLEITKTKYSALKLTPFEIKKRRDAYFYKLNNINYDFPIKNAHTFKKDFIINLKNKIRGAVNKLSFANKFKNQFTTDYFISPEFKRLENLSIIIEDLFIEFQNISNQLQDLYELNKINDLNSVKYLKNLEILDKSPQYIEKDDVETLNKFLKCKLSTNFSIGESGSLMYSDIQHLKSQLLKFNDAIDIIREKLEQWGLSKYDINEFQGYSDLLNSYPYFISDFDEFNNSFSLLKNYKNKKRFNGTSKKYIYDYLANKTTIKTIIKSYEHFFNKKLKYISADEDITVLIELLNNLGINVSNLKDYNDVKDMLPRLNHACIIDNENYYVFHDKLVDFVKTDNKSFKHYIDKYQDIFKEYSVQFKSFLNNNYSKQIKLCTQNLMKISELLNDLKIKFDNFNQIMEYKDVFYILADQSKYLKNFDSIQLVEDLENILKNYDVENNNILDLQGIEIDKLKSLFADFSKDIDLSVYGKSDFEYSKRLLDNLLMEFKNMGLNFQTISDLKNSPKYFDVLIKNPIEYNENDLEKFSNLIKIQREFNNDNLEDINENLNEQKTILITEINNSLNQVYDSENDFKLIKSKINDIVILIKKICDVVGCQQINSVSNIDSFIENINILNNNPVFIEDFKEVEGYVNCLSNLKSMHSFNESKLNNFKLNISQIENHRFNEKLLKLGTILDGCANENIPVDSLIIDFDELVEKINNLNINADIADENLDDYLDQLKVDSKIYSFYGLSDKIISKSIKKSKSKKENSLFSKLENLTFIDKNYTIKNYPKTVFTYPVSRNKNLNNDTYSFDEFINYKNNNPIEKFFKNTQMNNAEIIDEICSLQEYMIEFNNIYNNLASILDESLSVVSNYEKNYEMYNSQIKKLLYKFYPNSFNGLNSKIDELNTELERNKIYSKLISSGFFINQNLSELNLVEVNKLLIDLNDYKVELLNILSKYDISEEDSFNETLIKINNSLDDISKSKECEVTELINLEYIRKNIDESSIIKLDEINIKLAQISSLTNVVDKFDDDLSIKSIKNMLKINKQFNNLLENNIFEESIIEYLKNTPKNKLNDQIYNLNIKINSIINFSKSLNLNEDYSLIKLKKLIETTITKNYELIDEKIELAYLLECGEYQKLFEKVNSFIVNHSSKIDFNGYGNDFKTIKNNLNLFDRISDYSEYNINGKDMIQYSVDELYDLSVKLKNNLTLNKLFNEKHILNNHCDGDKVNELVKLLDDTAPLIEKEFYNENLNDIISKNREKIFEFEEISNIEIGINELINDNASKSFESYKKHFNLIRTTCEKYNFNFKHDISEINKKLDSLITLTNLFNELNPESGKPIYEYSYGELNDLVNDIQVNIEYTELLNNKTLDEKITSFNSNDYEKTVKQINSLVSKISTSLNNSSEDYLNINFTDLINNQDKESHAVFMDMKQSYELNNPLDVLDKLILLDEKIKLDDDYHDELLSCKNELQLAIELSEIENDIEKNSEIYIKHLKTSENFNLDNLSIEDIDKKQEIDIKFTNMYNEGIFSFKTIDMLNNQDVFSFNLDKSKLYDNLSEIYQINSDIDFEKIYDINDYLIDEINDLFTEANSIDEFCENIEDILNSYDGVELLLDTSYSTDFKKIIEKYGITDSNYLEIIENNVKYTELLDNQIYNDENLIKDNMANVIHDVGILIELSDYIKKQLYFISEFYSNHEGFNMDANSFNETNSIVDLKNSVKLFGQDIEKLKDYFDELEEITDNSEIVQRFVNLAIDEDINEDIVEDIFLYNVYNSILNTILNENSSLDEDSLNPEIYKKEYDKLNIKIEDNNKKYFVNSIYSILDDLNKTEIVEKQKQDLDLKISNNKNLPMKNIINDYANYIIANKRVFMMGIGLVPILLSESYGDLFDYVVLKKDMEIPELFVLSLLLRSKNKIIIID